MKKKSFQNKIITALSAFTLLLGGSLAGSDSFVRACEASSASASQSCISGPEANLLLVRDARASLGGGKGSCWRSCFDHYNICVDQVEKNVCVSQMKSCLAVCDNISNRPGM